MANIGSIDRVLRFALGAVLLVIAFAPPLAEYVGGMGTWKYALAAAGLVLIATAALRICPAYLLFGIRTCETGKR